MTHIMNKQNHLIKRNSLNLLDRNTELNHGKRGVDLIPKPVLSIIISYLPPKDLLNSIQLISKQYYSLINDPDHWKSIQRADTELKYRVKFIEFLGKDKKSYRVFRGLCRITQKPVLIKKILVEDIDPEALKLSEKFAHNLDSEASLYIFNLYLFFLREDTSYKWTGFLKDTYLWQFSFNIQTVPLFIVSNTSSNSRINIQSMINDYTLLLNS